MTTKGKTMNNGVRGMTAFLLLATIHPGWAGAGAGRALPEARSAVGVPQGRGLRTEVLALISGYEPGDPREALQRLGPAAAEMLIALSQDPAVSGLRRVRAIEVLGYVPTDAGLAYLRGVVAQTRGRGDGSSIYQLAAASRALGGFGSQVSAELVPLLGHRSADVREGVAAALGRIGTPEATAALRDRAQVERDSGVRAALKGALGTAASGGASR